MRPRALMALLALLILISPLRAPTPASAAASHAAVDNKFCVEPGSGNIAELNWLQRSDWINVRRDVTPAAEGDGKADDTRAIQAALDKIGKHPGDLKVVYFPPGTYRITKTLTITDRNGGMLIGHGLATRLVWDGERGGRMLWSNGASRQTYIGFVWDGNNKAAVGIDHDSKTQFETRVLHEQMEFRDFEVAGIRVGHDQKLASAEMLYSNLKFVHNGAGVLLQDWNDYNNVFQGCFFLNNKFGIRAEKGNVVVRDSRFEGSSQSDLFLSTHSHSVRRVVSLDSRMFLTTVRGPAAAGLVRVEDAVVSGWKNRDGAVVTRLRGPLVLFDVRFLDPPSARAPIRLDNPGYMNQLALLSDAVSPATKSLIDAGPNGIIREIPAAGRRGLDLTVNDHFLRDTMTIPDKVFDVKQDCGAKGDGSRDDAIAIQSCLAKANGVGHSAVVYFPSGIYKVSRTLEVPAGATFQIDGTGWHSRIVKQGRKQGPVLHIVDPDGLRVTHLTLGAPAGSDTLLQTGSRPGSVYYHNLFGYHDAERTNVWLHFEGLPAGTVVVGDHPDGRLRIHNSSAAKILLGFLVSVQMVIGGGGPQSGFLGILSRTSVLEDYPLVIKDNRSLVQSDWYNEQTTHLLSLQGGGDVGRVILDHTEARTTEPLIADIDGYKDLVAQLGGMFGRPHKRDAPFVRIRGGDDMGLVLAGNSFWNTPPVLDTLPKQNAVILANIVDSPHVNLLDRVHDHFPKGGNYNLNAVWEAFKELGAYDLSMNYCR